jgi:hypothetical protein
MFTSIRKWKTAGKTNREESIGWPVCIATFTLFNFGHLDKVKCKEAFQEGKLKPFTSDATKASPTRNTRKLCKGRRNYIRILSSFNSCCNVRQAGLMILTN